MKKWKIGEQSGRIFQRYRPAVVLRLVAGALLALGGLGGRYPLGVGVGGGLRLIGLEQLRLYLKKLEQFPERRELRRLWDTSSFYFYPEDGLTRKKKNGRGGEAYRDEGFSVVEEFEEVGELGFSHP